MKHTQDKHENILCFTMLVFRIELSLIVRIRLNWAYLRQSEVTGQRCVSNFLFWECTRCTYFQLLCLSLCVLTTSMPSTNYILYISKALQPFLIYCFEASDQTINLHFFHIWLCFQHTYQANLMLLNRSIHAYECLSLIYLSWGSGSGLSYFFSSSLLNWIYFIKIALLIAAEHLHKADCFAQSARV